MIQHEKLLFLACEKLHDFFTSIEDLILRYIENDACVSTVLIEERMINKTNLSFMQIFVYLISFVHT